MKRYPESYPESKPNTLPSARGFASLGVVTARAAHATPEAVVMRRRHLFAVEEGARNVGEDAPAFVYSRGRKIVAGVDAAPGAVGALRRHAEVAANGVYALERRKAA